MNFYQSNFFFFVFFCALIVPPNIDDTATSSDAVAKEGANVTLKCTATGSPKPTVKWKRDDNSKISINKTLSGMYSTFLFLLFQ